MTEADIGRTDPTFSLSIVAYMVKCQTRQILRMKRIVIPDEAKLRSGIQETVASPGF
jgi:hypothetical protein